MKVKEEVISLVQHLPEDITSDEIMYHLYVKQKVIRGLKDVEGGIKRVIEIIMSNSAKEDIKDTKNDLSRNSPEFAELLLSRIVEMIENLKLFPKMGRIVNK